MGIAYPIPEGIKNTEQYQGIDDVDGEVLQIAKDIRNYDRRLTLLFDKELERFVVSWWDPDYGSDHITNPARIIHIHANPDGSNRMLDSSIVRDLQIADKWTGEKQTYDDVLKNRAKQKELADARAKEITEERAKDAFRMAALGHHVLAPRVSMHLSDREMKRKKRVILPGE